MKRILFVVSLLICLIACAQEETNEAPLVTARAEAGEVNVRITHTLPKGGCVQDNEIFQVVVNIHAPGLGTPQQGVVEYTSRATRNGVEILNLTRNEKFEMTAGGQHTGNLRFVIKAEETNDSATFVVENFVYFTFVGQAGGKNCFIPPVQRVVPQRQA